MDDQDFTINIRTTADAAGIKEIERQLQQLKAQVAGQGGFNSDEAASEAHKLGRRINLLATAGVISSGYELVKVLRESATQIEKMSQDLNKQGEQLIKNAQKQAEMAAHATDEADVIKVAESGLKGMESAQARMLTAAAEEATIWQKIADIWAGGSKPFSLSGPIQDAMELRKQQAAQNLEIERQNTIYGISKAKIEEAKRATETYAEAVADLNAHIKTQEALSMKHLLEGDIDGYVKAAKSAEAYKNELNQLDAAHKKLTDKTQKYVEGADPQVKAILANEKAMFEARAAGKQQEAALFEKSALALRGSARPDQLADLSKIYSSPVVEESLKQIGINTRTLVELWK